MTVLDNNPSPAPGLREQKKDATRRALSAQAVKLTVAHGYHGFTIADLAASCGVSRRTFSNYFAGKAECLVATHEDMLEDTLQFLATADPMMPLEDLLRTLVEDMARCATDEFGDFLEIAAGEPEVRMQEMVFDDQMIQHIAEAVARRLKLPAGDVMARAIAGFGINAARGCIESWLVSGRKDGQAGLTALLQRAFSILNLDVLQRGAQK